jgi:hypothetical protein
VIIALIESEARTKMSGDGTVRGFKTHEIGRVACREDRVTRVEMAFSPTRDPYEPRLHRDVAGIHGCARKVMVGCEWELLIVMQEQR